MKTRKDKSLVSFQPPLPGPCSLSQGLSRPLSQELDPEFHQLKPPQLLMEGKPSGGSAPRAAHPQR